MLSSRVAGFDSQPVKIREVVFVDTEDFRLYNNAFILRRRIPYKDGFPIGDPEIVFKFRHPDMQVAAETDVRPAHSRRPSRQVQVPGAAAQGKTRRHPSAFSHNVQFLRSAIGMGRENVRDMDALVDLLPALQQA